MNKTVASRTYPICQGYFRKRSKTSCAENHILHTGDSSGATGWFISVKHKARNELICSVKWIEPWTGRAGTCQRPSMTAAREGGAATYGSIPWDTCEHVKLYNQIPQIPPPDIYIQNRVWEKKAAAASCHPSLFTRQQTALFQIWRNTTVSCGVIREDAALPSHLPSSVGDHHWAPQGKAAQPIFRIPPPNLLAIALAFPNGFLQPMKRWAVFLLLLSWRKGEDMVEDLNQQLMGAALMSWSSNPELRWWCHLLH